MATQLLTFDWTITTTESLDRAIDVPLDYALAAPGEAQESPLSDGSVFFASFKAARDANVLAVIRFATDYAGGDPTLSMGAFDPTQSKLTLAFAASQARMKQIPAGTYLGDLYQDRPREGALGPQVARVGLINLTIEYGTE